MHLHATYQIALQPVVVETPYSPVSQILDTFLLVHKETKIMAFKENYPSPALIKQYDLAQSWWILNWLIATVLARGKNIHIPSSLQAQKQCLTFNGNEKTTWLKSLFQISTSPMDRHIFDSEQDKPVIPYYSCRGILDRSFWPLRSTSIVLVLLYILHRE